MTRMLWLSLLLVGCRHDDVFTEIDPSLNRMQEQPRGDDYEASRLFADGKVLQRPPEGTRPHRPTREAPPRPDRSLLEEGRAHFDVICATCHGLDGSGESIVARFFLNRPTPLDLPRVRALGASGIELVIRQGSGAMPSYETVLDLRARWAVGYYVQALQLRRGARLDELPAPLAARFSREVGR